MLLRIIQDVRNKNPELFEKIKRLPKKSCSAKAIPPNSIDTISSDLLITFFRKGKLIKFFLSYKDLDSLLELDFLKTAKLFESLSNEKKVKLPI